MRRSMPSRAVAVVNALWLAVVLAEPAAIHACPMHDAMHGAMHAAAHAHASAGAPAAHQRGAHSSHRDDEAKPCTCVGACCATVAAVIPPLAGSVAASTYRQPLRPLPFRASTYRPLAVEHARPPTIGPPAITV